MGLEIQEKMVMVGGGLISVLKWGLSVSNTYFEHKSLHKYSRVLREWDENSQIIMCHQLVGTWIRRREVVNGARRIRSEKLREHQYMVGYARCLEC